MPIEGSNAFEISDDICICIYKYICCINMCKYVFLIEKWPLGGYTGLYE